MPNTNQPSELLLSIAEPQAWKDWLFHIQQNLIDAGYTETLTKEGRSDHTANFKGLYEFFGTLQAKTKNE